jgi:hypothetical protein
MRGYMTIHTPETYKAWEDQKQADLNPAPES